MTCLDSDKLLAHIQHRQEARGQRDVSGLVIYAVLEGLAEAIRRGDFNREETP